MAKVEVWPTVHAERKALAADLGPLGPEAWTTPSLCREWTVRDVVAHMTATARIGGAGFFTKVAASGFSLTRMQAKDIAIERGTSPADTLARFETVVDAVKRLPGPVESVLGETLVHAEDVRRPLGIHHDYPMDALVQVAEFYARSNLVIGAKRRIAGLRLVGTDRSWSHGTGSEVRGPMLALLMAMTGRPGVLDDLRGEGVGELRRRSASG
ncbi:MAG TPA: maleylpyruvate isomerase family mycothiol-dependent enzyme [Acidimicrobiales bacterium]|nr:maleylpyruvate isomerase family mycothiol-dependent enzyme [Acidimicrobiales bacterium]